MTFVGRFRHTMRFTVRVWPQGKGAVRLSTQRKEIPVSGMWLNGQGHMEAVYRYGRNPNQYQAFELSDEDADKVVSVGAADAILGELKVHCPGTTDQGVKKACYLEVNVTVYPNAATTRPYLGAGSLAIMCCEDEIPDRLRAFWDRQRASNIRAERATHGTKADAAVARMEPYEYAGHVIYTNPQLVDVDIVAQQVLSGKAVLFSASAFTGRMVDLIRQRLDYYVVPGRRPEEEGGLFRGYQLAGYVFRYYPKTRVPEGVDRLAAHMEKMHSVTKAKGQVRRRDVYIRGVIDRIAHKYGISEQRVMTRFIEGGILDYLIRSYDTAASDGRLYIHGIPAYDLRGFVNHSARVVSFIVEGMTEEEVSA